MTDSWHIDWIEKLIREGIISLEERKDANTHWPQVRVNTLEEVDKLVGVVRAQKEKLLRLEGILRESKSDAAAFTLHLEKCKARITTLLKLFGYSGRGDYYDFELRASAEPDVEDMGEKKIAKMQWYVHVSYLSGPRADTPALALDVFIADLKSKIAEQRKRDLSAADNARRVLEDLERI